MSSDAPSPLFSHVVGERGRALIIGNWKMNGLLAASDVFDRVVSGAAERAAADPRAAAVAVCPPATLLAGFAERARATLVGVGAQTCHPEPAGARTGEISAEMIVDLGGDLVIVGHSERRAPKAEGGAGETDADVAARAAAGHRAGLIAVVCLGESEAERDAGRAEAVVSAQVAASLPDGATVANTVVAYEPIWAIGTGRTPTLQEITATHEAVKAALAARLGANADGVRVLYGGSVKPGNAAEILSARGVDGALVGGASLKAEDFLAIIDAA